MKSKGWTFDDIILSKTEIANKRFEQLLAELWNVLVNSKSLPKTELSFAKIQMVNRLNKKGDQNA